MCHDNVEGKDIINKMVKRKLEVFIVPLISINLISCYNNKNNQSSYISSQEPLSISGNIKMDEEINNQSVIFKINDTILDIFWADNESVSSLKTLAKDTLSINMHRYGDFEQVGSLNINLPANDEIITTSPGDICLYQSNQLVIFYGSNTYNYTKLGHINMSKLELRDLLSEEDVNITISLKSE